MEDPDESSGIQNEDKQEETDGIDINSLFNYLMYSYFILLYFTL